MHVKKHGREHEDGSAIHPYIPELIDGLEAGRVNWREFLRTACLLGMSATAAYAVAGRITGESMMPAVTPMLRSFPSENVCLYQASRR